MSAQTQKRLGLVRKTHRELNPKIDVVEFEEHINVSTKDGFKVRLSDWDVARGGERRGRLSCNTLCWRPRRRQRCRRQTRFLSVPFHLFALCDVISKSVNSQYCSDQNPSTPFCLLILEGRTILLKLCVEAFAVLEQESPGR